MSPKQTILLEAILPAMVFTCTSQPSVFEFGITGNTLTFINVLVLPGSKRTLNSFFKIIAPIFPMTSTVIGISLGSFGFCPFGTVFLYKIPHDNENHGGLYSSNYFVRVKI